MAIQQETTKVGPRVRQLRNARGWSAEALAERAGVSTATIYDIEAEGSNPTLTTLVGVARGLGVTLDQLVDLRSEEGQRLRLIRLLADPVETPDDVTAALMRQMRRLLAEEDDSAPR